MGFTIFCGLKLKHLDFNYNFEAFFPNEDHELEVYNKFREQFEYDNEFVLISLENKVGIFNEDFLHKINSLTNQLQQLNYVSKVTSPTNLKHLSLGGISPAQISVLHYNNPDLYKYDSTFIYESGTYVGSFFPANAKSVCLYIKTEDNLSKSKSDTLAKSILSCINNFKFDEIHYAGRIFAQDVYLKNLQREFVYFMLISFFLVVVFLWISFRSVFGIIVTVSVVLISVIWTLGFMSIINKPIDIMTVMLPTMIFIAGMSDVVHFFSKYADELKKGTEKIKIYPLIIKEVGIPTFLTLLTTVVGFLSLLFSSIKPVRDFGIYTSIGISVAFILSYTLLPAIFYFFNPKVKKQKVGNSILFNLMRNVLFFIFRKQKLIIGITILLTIVSLVGILKIKVNNILLEDLNDKVKIKQDFNFFDKNYSGVRPVELLISINQTEKNIWDYDIITQLNQLDEFIKKEYGAGFLYSPATLVKSVYSANNNVKKNSFPDPEEYENIARLLKSNKKNKEIQRLVSPDFLSARITAKIQDKGSLVIAKSNEALNEFIRKRLNTNQIDVTITGAAHLVDRNNEYMVSNMTKGFLFSIIVIALLTLILHRSARMVLVFIIPNTIPLLIVAGIMGFAGIELKAATSIVFSIAFGIATDDTIHFISRLKIELEYGKSLLYAFKRTFFETGKPIMLTTFILMGGFMSLMISDFKSTFYFGLLICITVIFALLCDIFLLPVLLFLLYKKKGVNNFQKT